MEVDENALETELQMEKLELPNRRQIAVDTRTNSQRDDTERSVGSKLSCDDCNLLYFEYACLGLRKTNRQMVFGI